METEYLCSLRNWDALVVGPSIGLGGGQEGFNQLELVAGKVAGVCSGHGSHGARGLSTFSLYRVSFLTPPWGF